MRKLRWVDAFCGSMRPETIIGLLMLSLVVFFVVGPHMVPRHPASKVDRAKLLLRKLAYETFPQWKSHHPDKMCPDKVEELTQLMGREATDPWGRPILMLCSRHVIGGAKPIALFSLGEDGQLGTDDDVSTH